MGHEGTVTWRCWGGRVSAAGWSLVRCCLGPRHFCRSSPPSPSDWCCASPEGHWRPLVAETAEGGRSSNSSGSCSSSDGEASRFTVETVWQQFLKVLKESVCRKSRTDLGFLCWFNLSISPKSELKNLLSQAHPIWTHESSDFPKLSSILRPLSSSFHQGQSLNVWKSAFPVAPLQHWCHIRSYVRSQLGMSIAPPWSPKLVGQSRNGKNVPISGWNKASFDSGSHVGRRHAKMGGGQREYLIDFGEEATPD